MGSGSGAGSGTVIITDLDGTLLHPRTYSFEEAEPALALVRARGIPLVLCSSKTRAEIELWRRRLGNRDPFIAENGGGIFVPEGLFGEAVPGPGSGGYRVIVLGTAYAELRAALERLREELGVAVTGFGDMSVEQVGELTGLPPEEAELARRREFDEPFVFVPGEPRVEEFLRAIEGRGLRWTRGAIHHVLGASDKGRAARILVGLYAGDGPPPRTIGLGDGLNDLPLLEAVDVPVLIQRGDGGYEEQVRLPGLLRPPGIGPAGWNRAVTELLEAA